MAPPTPARSSAERIEQAQNWIIAGGGDIALTDRVGTILLRGVEKAERTRPSRNLKSEAAVLLPVIVLILTELRDLIPNLTGLDVAEITRMVFEVQEMLGQQYNWVPLHARNVGAYEGLVTKALKMTRKRESYSWPRAWY